MKRKLREREERANTFTHGLGVILSILALIVLIENAIRIGTVWHIFSYSIYGASLIVLYTASTMFHAQRNLRRKTYLNKIDHMAIYVLIAGTYTPFALIAIQGILGWVLFTLLWAMAIVGIIFQFRYYTKKYQKISTYLYIAMGWTGVIAGQRMYSQLSTDSILWLTISVVLCTSSVYFYLRSNRPFYHTIFHMFILFGSFGQFLAIYYFL